MRCFERDFGGAIALNSVSQKRSTYGSTPISFATSPIRKYVRSGILAI